MSEKLKIVSWNCHYGLDKTKFKKIMKDANFCNADIYAFQEVLENEFIDIAAFDESKDYIYRHWYGDHQEYGNCHIPRGEEGDLGIVLMSKKYRIQRFDQGLIRFRYVVPYIVSAENERFILIHVWTKAFPDGYIEPIYKALEYYKEQFEIEDINKIIMLGDFNLGIDFKNPQHKKILEKIEGRINEIYGLIRSKSFDSCETFKYARNKKYYFNDCIYTKNISKIEISIGNKKDWVEGKEFSDHCPIMAKLELQ